MPRSEAFVPALRSACSGATRAAEMAGASTAPTVSSPAPSTTAKAAPSGKPGAESVLPGPRRWPERPDPELGRADSHGAAEQPHDRSLDGQGPHQLAGLGADRAQQRQLAQPLGEHDPEGRGGHQRCGDNRDGDEHRHQHEDLVKALAASLASSVRVASPVVILIAGAVNLGRCRNLAHQRVRVHAGRCQDVDPLIAGPASEGGGDDVRGVGTRPVAGGLLTTPVTVTLTGGALVAAPQPQGAAGCGAEEFRGLALEGDLSLGLRVDAGDEGDTGERTGAGVGGHFDTVARRRVADLNESLIRPTACATPGVRWIAAICFGLIGVFQLALTTTLTAFERFAERVEGGACDDVVCDHGAEHHERGDQHRQPRHEQPPGPAQDPAELSAQHTCVHRTAARSCGPARSCNASATDARVGPSISVTMRPSAKTNARSAYAAAIGSWVTITTV